MTLEDRIGDLFDDAISIHDTVWYTEHETLFDAVMRTIEKYNQE